MKDTLISGLSHPGSVERSDSAARDWLLQELLRVFLRVRLRVLLKRRRRRATRSRDQRTIDRARLLPVRRTTDGTAPGAESLAVLLCVPALGDDISALSSPTVLASKLSLSAHNHRAASQPPRGMNPCYVPDRCSGGTA